MRECPSCGLCNPDTQVVCDCGFDLVHGQAEFERRRRVRAASATMGVGIAMVALPIVIAIALAGTGRIYMLYGLAVAGAVIFWRGLMSYQRALKGADAERRQIDAWRTAMRLPNRDD